MMVGEIKDW